jgi:hypothetical protein
LKSFRRFSTTGELLVSFATSFVFEFTKETQMVTMQGNPTATHSKMAEAGLAMIE